MTAEIPCRPIGVHPKNSLESTPGASEGHRCRLLDVGANALGS
jgi:hypothetical protein